MSRAQVLQRNSRRAFSLVEMLAVITVIGILCTVLFKLGFYVFEQNDISKAESEREGLVAALSEYKNSKKRYPQTRGLSDEKLMGSRLYMALAGYTDHGGQRLSGGISLLRSMSMNDLPVNEGDAGQGPELVDHFAADPWGNPYVYLCPSLNGASDYLLFSKGPDGRASTDSDGASDDDKDNIPNNYPSEQF